jgi:hypothetical protein
MRIIRPTIAVGIMMLALTACAPSAPDPTPPVTTTPTALPSASPTQLDVTPETPQPEEEVVVTAAVVVVTASTTSVFGTDGSTLASVDYEMDGEAAVEELAEALDAEPEVSRIPGESDGPCPPATSYDFGGLVVRSPGSLWAAGSIEIIVTAAATSEGVGIETVAGQQIGASRSAFRTAVGESMVLYEDRNRIGFDVLNPEAHEWDRIGVYAEFSGGELDYLATPNRLGFIGSCA